MRLWVALIIFLSIQFPTCLFAEQVLPTLYIYEDSATETSVDSIIKLYRQGRLLQAPPSGKNISFTNSYYWLVFENFSENALDSFYINIGNHHINRIHFYRYHKGKTILEWVTGDYFLFSQRPIKATGYYFPINYPGIYLARIDKRNESLQLSYQFTGIINAIQKESNTKSIMALLTGIMILMIVFGLFLFIAERSYLYICYSVFIATGWLWVVSNAGLGFEYLWPKAPQFASKARVIFSIVSIIFSSVFMRLFIGSITNKVLNYTLHIINILLLLCLFLVLIASQVNKSAFVWVLVQQIIFLLPAAYLLTSFTILVQELFKGNRYAGFYLAAQFVLILSVSLQVSFMWGWLNLTNDFINQFSVAFGYTAEAIIITAGLAYKFNRYRLDKELLLQQINVQQKENTAKLIEAEQEERGRIANQLHDIVGSWLSAVKLSLSALLEKKHAHTEETIASLEKTTHAIDVVSTTVRNLSHSLSPIMLSQVGFKSAIHKIISLLNSTGKIEFELIVVGFTTFNPAVMPYYNGIYNIVYELLNNTVKHSSASKAILQLVEHEDLYSIMIEDDGIGLKDEKLVEEGMGFTSIRSKVTYWQGSLDIDNNRTGLTIIIEIPKANA
jgi:two-component system, sensor histidine kinase LadS